MEGKVIAVQPPDSSHDLPPLQGSHTRPSFPDQETPSATASSRFSKQVSFSHLPSHPVIKYPFRQECSSLRKLGLTSLLPSGLLRCDALIQACISWPSLLKFLPPSSPAPNHFIQTSFLFFFLSGQTLTYLHIISYLLCFFIIYLALLEYKLNEAYSLCLFCSKIDPMCLAHCLTHGRSLTTIQCIKELSKSVMKVVRLYKFIYKIWTYYT